MQGSNFVSCNLQDKNFLSCNLKITISYFAICKIAYCHHAISMKVTCYCEVYKSIPEKWEMGPGTCTWNLEVKPESGECKMFNFLLYIQTTILETNHFLRRHFLSAKPHSQVINIYSGYQKNLFFITWYLHRTFCTLLYLLLHCNVSASLNIITQPPFQ